MSTAELEARHDPAHWLTVFNSYARELNQGQAASEWAKSIDDARFLRGVLENYIGAAERMLERQTR